MGIWGLRARAVSTPSSSTTPGSRCWQAREDAVQGIVKEAHNKLGSLTSDKKAYRSLLTDLTVQARWLCVTVSVCHGALL